MVTERKADLVKRWVIAITAIAIGGYGSYVVLALMGTFD